MASRAENVLCFAVIKKEVSVSQQRFFWMIHSLIVGDMGCRTDAAILVVRSRAETMCHFTAIPCLFLQPTEPL